MAEPSQLKIRRDFPRPTAAERAAFERAPTGWVVDAQGRRGALPHWIRPLSTATRFVGTALTVRTRPVDNLAPYAALKFAKPGDVLVVAVDGSDTASVLGDILLGMARNAGIVAAVTDGVVRDITGINQVGLPTFACGLSPNSPLKDGPGEVGYPVTLGGGRSREVATDPELRGLGHDGHLVWRAGGSAFPDASNTCAAVRSA
jgi:4-hydroxy-4-methyl-2-oxoglutarate aldolase